VTNGPAMPLAAVAFSARALAQAARRAGEPCLALDLFGDADTAEAAAGMTLVRGDLERGFDRGDLLGKLRSLRGRVAGVVYGAGFEGAPDLLEEIGGILPLVGNGAAAVRGVKDPAGLAVLFAQAGLPHPEIAQGALPRDGEWLAKVQGGSGGEHVTPADSHRQPDIPGDPRLYFQRRVPGEAVSALFLADGHRRALVIGLTAQWCSPAPAAPFRFGGCAGPVSLTESLARRIAQACDALVAMTGMVGLNSLDLLIDGDTVHAIEINPRPGATLDVFDALCDPPLWRLHREAALYGFLPDRVALGEGARAAAIFHAPARLYVDASLRWPAWVADRPAAGSEIEAGMPVCTVLASAPDAGVARRCAEERAAMLRSTLPFDDAGHSRRLRRNA
jgi:uncharacterized protein